jgi:hypothetical protein
MKTLDKEFANLKSIEQYTDQDLKAAKISKEVFAEYKQMAEEEVVTKREAVKEKKEFLKEEMARIRALKREYGTTQKWVKTIKTSKDKEALCIMFSDWHVGKVIKDLNGVMTFNTPKALELADLYAKRIVQYVADHALHKRIDEVVLMLLGDLIDNEIIYDTQVHKIDMPVMLQKQHACRGIINFVDTLEQGLKALGMKSPRIRIEGLRGNHGRVQKGALEVSSWEVVIYDTLDLYFAALGKKNITVGFSLEDTRLIDVKGTVGLLRHKAPPQAETPSARAKLGGWRDLHNWDWLVHGHFHHWGINSWNSRPVFRNGAFPGQDDLAMEMGVGDLRCQLIFGVNKNECPSFMQRIVLE